MRDVCRGHPVAQHCAKVPPHNAFTLTAIVCVSDTSVPVLQMWKQAWRLSVGMGVWARSPGLLHSGSCHHPTSVQKERGCSRRRFMVHFHRRSCWPCRRALTGLSGFLLTTLVVQDVEGPTSPVGPTVLGQCGETGCRV